MGIVFPTNVKQVYIPRNLDGTRSKLLFKIAHRYPDKKVYWHLDDEFLAVTERIHQLGIFASKEKHSLTLVDEDGVTLKTSFLVVDREDLPIQVSVTGSAIQANTGNCLHCII